MKIWILKVGETFSLDSSQRKMRTAQLAEVLAERGHQLTWWNSGFDHNSKTQKYEENTQIKIAENFRMNFVKANSYKSNFSFQRWYSNYKLSKSLAQSFEREQDKPDLFYISYPDHLMAYEALRFCQAHNIPSLVDIRDPWPDSFVDLSPKILRPFVSLALRKDLQKSRFVFEHATRVCSMMEKLLLWGKAKAIKNKKAFQKIFYLGAPSFRREQSSQNSRVLKTLASINPKNKTVLFAGAFGRSCYPIDIIKAASRFPQLNFICAGDGPYYDNLSKHKESLSNVHFTGWVNEQDIATLLLNSDIGVNCINENFEAVPNKFFTYLSGHLAIVSSIEGEQWKLIQEKGVGENYKRNDIESLEKALKKMIASDEKLESYKKNAKAFFAENSSDVIYQRMADYLESIPSAK